MVDVVSKLPTGGPMAQVRGLGPMFGGRLALICIHRVNRLLLYGALVVSDFSVHGHVTAPYKLSYY